jgi:hypothetical protein
LPCTPLALLAALASLAPLPQIDWPPEAFPHLSLPFRFAPLCCVINL